MSKLLIEDQNDFGEQQGYPIPIYMMRKLYHHGVEESWFAGRNISSSQDAIGRLCEVLADRGIISLEDVTYIAGAGKDAV